MAKFSMLRVRLALTIGVSFCFVLFLGYVLFWGSNKVSLYFQRSQRAYETFDRYEKLSQEAYRHFKQRMDLLLLETPATEQDVALSKDRLYQAIEALRDATTQETGIATDEDDRQEQQQELLRIARFTSFLESGMYRFDEVEQLRRQGKSDTARLLLSKFLEEEIDRKFQPLLDAAIDDERQQASKSEEKTAALIDRLRWLAIIAASVAAFFSLTAGAFLFRGIKRPIDALMRGTQEIASGNLQYRIDIDSRNEFGYLATHFNAMAEELELQQHKLYEAHAALEQKVIERTHELHQLNGQLQRMDQARREFFADISHELRTPITVIRGEAEVTLRGADRDAAEYKDALHRVVELSTQLGKLVNDLLFLARAEMASMHFEWEVQDLTALVAGVVEDLRVLAAEKSLAVALVVPATPVWVRGDKQRLRQVLFILGDNARRYSHAGGRIEVSLRADGESAALTVLDQGIGIPADDLEVIFDRYFRGADARRMGEVGLGLGLPMAKSIVKAHGGQIMAANAEGAGAAFTVTLPQLPESAADV